MITGPTARLKKFESTVRSVFHITDHQKASNRKLHWRRRGIVYQHGPRHVDVLLTELGLEHGNSAQAHATHDVAEGEAQPLDQAQHSKYESQVAACLFFSQDRADVTFIMIELCQKMSNPDQQSRANLKRHVTDSDWARCKELESRPSAGVTQLGNHPLKAIHAQAEDHRKKQCRGKALRSSIGSFQVQQSRVAFERSGLPDEASAGH